MMLSELSFLIELLLNHDLPKVTKDLVASRIRDVESNLGPRLSNAPGLPATGFITGASSHGKPAQAPSTLALMAKYGDLPDGTIMPTVIAPEPVAQVAHTPAAAAALNSRSAAINASIERKIDKETGRPKKW